jgi:phage gp46-like protein
MIFNQQGDVKLFQDIEVDGEINVSDGFVEMSSGLETSVYLSLFGGNEGDSGAAEDSLSWWGNIGEVESQQYRSRTQFLLRSIPAISSNLLRIEDAVNLDLKWMLTDKVASTIDVDVSLTALNRINITINIEARGRRERFNFTENWEATSL